MDRASIAYLVFAPVAIVAACFFIRKSREEHSSHIFSLWYIFFLSLQITSCLLGYIYCSVAWGCPKLTGTLATIVTSAYESTLNIREEFYIVSGFSGFVVLPQVLAYAVSGLFGYAQFPSALKWIDGFIAWSLIKFFIILAGIMGGQAIFSTFGHPYRTLHDIPSRLFYMSLFLAVSFFIFFALYEKERLFDLLARFRVGNAFARLNKFMTRHARAHATPGEEVSLDTIVLDYILSFLWPRIMRLVIRKALKAAGIYPSGPRPAASKP